MATASVGPNHGTRISICRTESGGASKVRFMKAWPPGRRSAGTTGPVVSITHRLRQVAAFSVFDTAKLRFEPGRTPAHPRNYWDGLPLSICVPVLATFSRTFIWPGRASRKQRTPDSSAAGPLTSAMAFPAPSTTVTSSNGWTTGPGSSPCCRAPPRRTGTTAASRCWARGGQTSGRRGPSRRLARRGNGRSDFQSELLASALGLNEERLLIRSSWPASISRAVMFFSRMPTRNTPLDWRA